MADVVLVPKTPLEEIGTVVINQLIQLASGYILALLNKPDEAAKVLANVGLPTDVNISLADFQKFLDSQKGKI